MWPGTCHRCDASSELKGVLPDKVLCFHWENIPYYAKLCWGPASAFKRSGFAPRAASLVAMS